jgi:hypothetical protein
VGSRIKTKNTPFAIHCCCYASQISQVRARCSCSLRKHIRDGFLHCLETQVLTLRPEGTTAICETDGRVLWLSAGAVLCCWSFGKPSASNAKFSSLSISQEKFSGKAHDLRESTSVMHCTAAGLLLSVATSSGDLPIETHGNTMAIEKCEKLNRQVGKDSDQRQHSYLPASSVDVKSTEYSANAFKNKM